MTISPLFRDLGTTRRVTLAGDLSSTTAEAARAALHAAVEADGGAGGARALRIELPTARLIDSVGLNVLVGIIKRVRASGGEVTIAVAHPSVERILTFTRLTTLIRLERLS